MRGIFILSEKKNMPSLLNRFFPYIVLLALFLAAVLFRPLLPVDETRYMTVAWEMYLKKDFLLPSLNFQPYHHKPPMLFWLINLAWDVLGVSRWAGLVPIFTAAAAMMLLTQKLTKEIFPTEEKLIKIVPWLMLGSVPFLLYSTMVMFDVMVTSIVLATILVVRSHARNPRFYKIILAAFLMAMGVLTKGPVVYIYILSSLLFFPFWKGEEERISNKSYYASLMASIVLSSLPVIAWLGMALPKTDTDFAFWLVWEQTMGRITGNFSAAHVRPFYFYFMVLPFLFLPWALFPFFLKNLRKQPFTAKSYKFLASATFPAFLCFLVISGKQPHYILPLLPYIVIFMGSLLEQTSMRSIKLTATMLACITIAGQSIASKTEFEKYNMAPFADFYARHKDSDWGFVRHYQGQIGFLGRSEKPIDDLQMENVQDWLKNHPDGYAIIRYNPLKDNMNEYKIVMTKPHRGKMLSIVQEK